jgi:hypothetical protein
MLWELAGVCSLVMAIVAHLLVPNFAVACVTSTVATVGLVWTLVSYHSMEWRTEMAIITLVALTVSCAVGGIIRMHWRKRRSRSET